MAIHLYSWSKLPRQTIFDGNLSRTALRTDGAIVTFNWFEPRVPPSVELRYLYRDDRATLGAAGVTGPKKSAAERRMGSGKRNEPRRTYEYQKTSERP
jgi:hypothetical protein